MRAIPAASLAVCGLGGCDAVLFRTLYPSFLEPDSSTGLFELVLRSAGTAQSPNAGNLVVTLGDSRFAYAPRLANEISARTGYVFRHAGVAGTDARSWYYMLRDLDPSGRDIARSSWASTITMTRTILAISTTSKPFITWPRLGWRDAWNFAKSCHDRGLQWAALRGSLLKRLVYRSDLLAFLRDPMKRIRCPTVSPRL